MSDSLVESICSTLAAGLVTPEDMLLPELAVGWLACHIPTREYARPYEPPPPLRFTAAAPRTSAPETGGDKQIRAFDVLEHITSGAATVAVNAQRDGTSTTVTSDAGADTHQQLQEAIHRTLPVATELLTDAIYGAAGPPRAALVPTLARLLVALLLEPLRLEVELEFAQPPNAGAERALATASDRLEADRLFQTHLAALTVHWFSGIAELGAPYRVLAPDTLLAVRALFDNHPALFRDVRAGPLEWRLAGFRYNARLARALDRGRLVGAFARSFVASESGAADAARAVALAAIDRAMIDALDVVRTPAGSALTTTERVVDACETARRLLRALPIASAGVEASTTTPIERAEAFLAALRARY